ncbi:hypothetical protein CHU92_12675 [Flavobacterium cyanobacteriorum]|uniref:VOC domain-containing protein n=1 Tax=Flavobacterium cyanobacteriorum TaxID=2022802 RepID=A0A255YVH3_9FLAO|nr:VOC family protein [Flavobacterium cyanobacteriorum]OYQ33246.1 hypothetical protein CHU92_12675 [Flavobacterium cyanobacteriorum]
MAIELVNWVEIPVQNMVRARKFYEAVFEFSLADVEIDGVTYPCFPNKNDDGFSGALVQYDFTSPGRSGALVYFAASPDVATMLGRVLAAGGNIIRERTEIAPGFGYYALFEDSEGNTLALQGME